MGPVMDRVLVAVLALLLAGCASASKPLAQAALNGDTATVQALLAQGARVNGRGPAGITPLMLAAQRGPPETVGALLEAKADVNASRGKPEEGRTALIDAAWGGHTEVVRLLLARGANANAQAESGATALTAGALRGFAG